PLPLLHHITRLKWIHITFIILTPQHSPELWFSGGTSSHDSVPTQLTPEFRYIVGSAALFRNLGSSGDTDGSLLSW
ncbi:hypothetical protein, partial [Vibrio thalassae]|uniref:hypothetical protein n=1 Tax=Vibrio thalassae TaxID=1243014 RepID=UPI00362C1B15